MARLADAVPGMTGNRYMIAWMQGQRWLIHPFDRGTATNEENPFIRRLIIPEALRAGLTMGGDALNLKTRLFKKCGEHFFHGSQWDSAQQRMNVDHGKVNLREWMIMTC